MTKECMNTMQEKLAIQLKQLRIEKGYSLEELSLKTRIGSVKLSRFENDEEIPSESALLLLSNALEIPVSNLVDGIQQ